MRFALRFSTVLLTSATLACGSDNPVSPDQATTTFAASTSTTITAVVGAPVTAIPSVRATDASGNPVAGATVTFAITGGGTLGRTTTTTNANGTADVGS